MVLVFRSIMKYFFALVGMGGIAALFVYLFFDAANRKLKKHGIRFSLVGFSIVILIAFVEIYLT